MVDLEKLIADLDMGKDLAVAPKGLARSPRTTQSNSAKLIEQLTA